MAFTRLHHVVIVIGLLSVLQVHSPTVHAAERPNFVWLLSEDNSKHYLKLFDETGAATPHIDKLASEGLAFERAFSCSPVCSVARTTLMTCVYAPRIGAQFHRKIQPVSLPEAWSLFPAYLRKAGYYTSNNVKEDYNTVKDSAVWDDSSRRANWSNRPNPETPFFHMQSYPVSHESSLHFSQEEMQADHLETNPEDVTLAPYHPDTKLFRYTYARYHDRMKRVDDIVGGVVAQLEKEGLLDDTFIFYFGDHGGVLPRSKGYIYESGLHIPLVVRVPEKWQHFVNRQRGSRVAGFVEVVDFGPTVLNLAGVPIPPHFDGKSFLGPGVETAEVNQRDEAFGYADRFDEKYDMCRSLRKGRYKYIRNYQAFYPDSLQNNYRYNMLAYRQWRQLYQQGSLNDIQKQFFEPKAAEALYDLSEDPYETKNLAMEPEHRDVLLDMRKRLSDRVKKLPDLSFYPESYLVEHAVQEPISFGKSHAKEIARLVEIADLSLQPFDDVEDQLRAALQSADRWERYWAAIACSVYGEKALPLADVAKSLLNDDELLVRVRSAEFLAIVGKQDPVPVLMQVLKDAESPVVALLTLNSVVFLQDGPWDYQFNIRPEHIRAKSDLVARRLEYLSQ